jgi:uncharacterized membrane protein YvbJ
MLDCKFCGAPIGDGDPYCKNCGYDPKTDRISSEFVPAAAAKAKADSAAVSKKAISPAVKNFAIIALIVLVFSIFYKNHFSIGNVIAEVRQVFTMISKGNFKIWESQPSKEIEWIDVRTFEEYGTKRY